MKNKLVTQILQQKKLIAFTFVVGTIFIVVASTNIAPSLFNNSIDVGETLVEESSSFDLESSNRLVNSIDDNARCNSKLSVMYNGNYGSIVGKEAYFNLVLTNNSSDVQEYSIVTEFLKTDCSNKHNKKKSNNVSLITSLLRDDMKSLNGNSIVVKGKQTTNFKVKLELPKGTSYNSWSCINVQANSNNCPNGSINTVLKVFVANPNEG